MQAKVISPGEDGHTVICVIAGICGGVADGHKHILETYKYATTSSDHMTRS